MLPGRWCCALMGRVTSAFFFLIVVAGVVNDLTIRFDADVCVFNVLGTP